MCCGQTKTWENTTSMLDYWRVGPLPTQSFEFCCPSIAMAWRLLHPTHWTDHRHVHPWWLPAIEMANPNAWQVGCWWIKLIWVKWKNLRPCLISWWDFCLLQFPLKWGQVKLNTSISSMKAWRNMVFGEIVLAIDKIWPPNIPSTYHFLGATATYFCQFNLFDNGKEVLQFKNADVHKPSSCCISTYISHTSKQGYMPLLLILHCAHCTFVRIDATNDSKTSMTRSPTRPSYCYRGFEINVCSCCIALREKTLPEIMP